MRATGVLWWFVCALAAAPVAGSDEFPYFAYIQTDDVHVRSGPGRNYYPTEKLAKGTAVEVYRHDPGGWLAIRPTENSFSWVSARYVDAGDEGLGTVTQDRAVARVGSKFSSVRDVIQVRLEKGETVEIVGEHNAGGQTWYKIAPPAGEFRWVFGRYVNDEPAHDGVSKPRRKPFVDQADDGYDEDEYDEEPRAKRAAFRDDAREEFSRGYDWTPRSRDATAEKRAFNSPRSTEPRRVADEITMRGKLRRQSAGARRLARRPTTIRSSWSWKTSSTSSRRWWPKSRPSGRSRS